MTGEGTIDPHCALERFAGRAISPRPIWRIIGQFDRSRQMVCARGGYHDILMFGIAAESSPAWPFGASEEAA